MWTDILEHVQPPFNHSQCGRLKSGLRCSGPRFHMQKPSKYESTQAENYSVCECSVALNEALQKRCPFFTAGAICLFYKHDVPVCVDQRQQLEKVWSLFHSSCVCVSSGSDLWRRPAARWRWAGPHVPSSRWRAACPCTMALPEQKHRENKHL